MTSSPAFGSVSESVSGPTTVANTVDRAVTVTVDGRAVTGRAGQSLAGLLLDDGQRSWRTTSAQGAPRGVFCGIGVCFDCLVEVNGLPDVRACLRRAVDGDVVVRQHVPLPRTDRTDRTDRPDRTEERS